MIPCSIPSCYCTDPGGRMAPWVRKPTFPPGSIVQFDHRAAGYPHWGVEALLVPMRASRSTDARAESHAQKPQDDAK